jgi:hypothetical protein
VAQAWSEYEGRQQQARTEEFFDQLTAELRALLEKFSDLNQRVTELADAAEVLELAVGAARRETEAVKRSQFSKIYSSFLSEPRGTTPDERINLIHHLEQLSMADLTVLRQFAQGPNRGDVLTRTTHGGWSPVGVDDPNPNWLREHGPLVHSLAKLESRGLIHEATINASFAHAGDAGSAFNRFRRRAWQITPIGLKLLKSIRFGG